MYIPKRKPVRPWRNKFTPPWSDGDTKLSLSLCILFEQLQKHLQEQQTAVDKLSDT